MIAVSEASVVLLCVAIIAALASITSAEMSRRGRRDQRTGNGSAIGPTVRRIDQSQEIISAQLHTNTNELLALHHKADRSFEVSRAVEDKLDRHLTEVSPMVSWAKTQMQKEG